MNPIVLIHGYKAESKQTTKSAIEKIYHTLPHDLKKTYGKNAVVEINLSRYMSLEDGVTIDDISRALDRALHSKAHQHLLKGPFHIVIHSTGALVIRNWIRRYSPKPSPIGNLVYLAGANFGSGWAHIGKAQLAKWGRKILTSREMGVRVLSALEFGSSWTLDLHLQLIAEGFEVFKDYKVREFVIIGSQAKEGWFVAPVRYAKEDGSDGVVRVSACNLNFSYLRIEATYTGKRLSWQQAAQQDRRHLSWTREPGSYYHITKAYQSGTESAPRIPFAIPYNCAHSGASTGVVGGSQNRGQVFKLITAALETESRNWAQRVKLFERETEQTYQLAAKRNVAPFYRKWVQDPPAQYDPHAQVIFRVTDQYGAPVNDFDIFFNSHQDLHRTALPINALMEHKHINKETPNVIAFYLRTSAFDESTKTWIDRVPQVRGCDLEITGNEPETNDILYVPLRVRFTKDELVKWIRNHETTIIDVVLLRLPSPKVYKLVKY